MKNKTTIRRSSKRSRYTTLQNATLQNRNLSYEARGLLAYLLSLPPDWILQPSQLEQEGARRDKISRMIGELVTATHITKTDLRNENGQYSGIEYTVHEEPQTALPQTDSPQTDLPYTVDHPLQTTYLEDSFTNEIENKPITTTNDPPPPLQVFSEKGELEKFNLLYGVTRVTEVCSIAITKKNPSGWAVRALQENWNIKSQIPPPKPKYEPDSDWDYFYHYLTTVHNLSEKEAEKYMEKNGGERFHFGAYSYNKECGHVNQYQEDELVINGGPPDDSDESDNLGNIEKEFTPEPVDFDGDLPL